MPDMLLNRTIESLLIELLEEPTLHLHLNQVTLEGEEVSNISQQ